MTLRKHNITSRRVGDLVSTIKSMQPLLLSISKNILADLVTKVNGWVKNIMAPEIFREIFIWSYIKEAMERNVKK